jgi:hypothetical protein
MKKQRQENYHADLRVWVGLRIIPGVLKTAAPGHPLILPSPQVPFSGSSVPRAPGTTRRKPARVMVAK